MPYKSKAQHRLFRVLEAQGKLPKGTASEWAHHTPSMAKLPERLHEKEEENKEAATKQPQTPPNYRMALGTVSTCGTCKDYNAGSSMCEQFQYPVQNTYTCDAWEQSKTAMNNVKLDESKIPSPPDNELASGNFDQPKLKLAAFASPQQANANPVRPIQPISFGGSGATAQPINSKPLGPKAVTPQNMVNQQQAQPQQAQPAPTRPATVQGLAPANIIQMLDDLAKQEMRQKAPALAKRSCYLPDSLARLAKI